MLPLCVTAPGTCASREQGSSGHVWHCLCCLIAGSRVPHGVLLVLPCPAHRETGGLLLLMPWEHLSTSPFPPPSVVSVFGGRRGWSALHCAAEGCVPEGHLSFSLMMNHPPEPSLCSAAGLLTPVLSHSLSSGRPEAFVENEAQKVALEEEA